MENDLNADNKKKKLTLREFFSIGEVGGYFFRKKSTERPRNINLRLMHGINRLAIIIFLASLIYFLLKKFVF